MHTHTQPNIRPFLLWDVNIKGFDFVKNKQLVIARACSLGNFSDFKEVIKFYGLSVIKIELQKTATMDPKSLAFFSHYLNIPLEKFKCYSKKQSQIQP